MPRPPESLLRARVSELVKRSIDCSVAALALAATSPVLAVSALAIKLEDHGSVFFVQRRLGRHGRIIKLYKLRTMRPSAPDIRNADGSTYAGPHDPRVTRVGRVLRSLSIDELPQLWNVIRGDLSLVGPRPELPDQLRYYRDEDHARLTVRPGLTGLSQISGRNALAWQDRRDLDLEYLRRQSLLVDLSILARTIPLVLGKRGVTQVHSDERADALDES